MNVMGGQSEDPLLLLYKRSSNLTFSAYLFRRSWLHSRYSMHALEEPAKCILVVGINQSNIVSFPFIRLAIVNQAYCHF